MDIASSVCELPDCLLVEYRQDGSSTCRSLPMESLLCGQQEPRVDKTSRRLFIIQDDGRHVQPILDRLEADEGFGPSHLEVIPWFRNPFPGKNVPHLPSHQRHDRLARLEWVGVRETFPARPGQKLPSRLTKMVGYHTSYGSGFKEVVAACLNPTPLLPENSLESSEEMRFFSPVVLSRQYASIWFNGEYDAVGDTSSWTTGELSEMPFQIHSTRRIDLTLDRPLRDRHPRPTGSSPEYRAIQNLQINFVVASSALHSILPILPRSKSLC